MRPPVPVLYSEIDGRPVGTAAQERIGRAIVAALLLLPDPERDRWIDALDGRGVWVDLEIEPSGWLVFRLDGLPDARIRESALGGSILGG